LAATAISRTTFMSCGAAASSIGRAPLTARTSLSPPKYAPTPEMDPIARANAVVATPPAADPNIA
jgi:hypothetical protein